MSLQNNIGSHIGVDCDYASHRADPFGPNGGGDGTKYSSLDTFNGESQVDKEMSLGYGTNSTSESEQKHEAAMKALLLVIDVDRKLEQKPALEGLGGSGKPRT